jgi:Zn-dependent metalloprotease
MHSCVDPRNCFVPPHIIDHMAQSLDPATRARAIATKDKAAAARAVRAAFAAFAPRLATVPSPGFRKHRLVYDMEGRDWPLPGKLRRQEGQEQKTGDDAVDEAYDFAGVTYDFYKELFGRNSLDNRGMTLISTVHYDDRTNNAYWDWRQMLYEDGDSVAFTRFTKALEVVAHELTHGVIQYTCGLLYEDEPGALNEHFADVMSIVAEQWHKRHSVQEADWWLGGEVIMPEMGIKGIRTFTEEKAFENHPYFGTDPQPKHYRDKYTGPADNGGVHINSGIPNHAFYRVAMELGGNSWERAGKIWYKTMVSLTSESRFKDAAINSYAIAGAEYGAGSREQQAVKKAWDAVGVTFEAIIA